MTSGTDAEFWDSKYREHPTPRRQEPNPVLAEVAVSLSPGVALDLGCGEGADALWLSAQGWRVTGVDVSGVALERAKARSGGAARCWSWRNTSPIRRRPWGGRLMPTFTSRLTKWPHGFLTQTGRFASGGPGRDA